MNNVYKTAHSLEEEPCSQMVAMRHPRCPLGYPLRGICGTHTVSVHPREPGLPSSLRSGPRSHQDPESTQRQCSGRCLSLQPGHPQPPCGTDRSLPCSAVALQQPASPSRELQPPQPCRSAVPRLPVEWLAPLAPQEGLSQRIPTGVYVSLFWSEPSNPAQAPALRAL